MERVETMGVGTVAGGSTEGARRATGVEPPAAGPPRADPEVVAKARRRRFSAKYKSRILDLADRCNEQGEVGALLRREGLYSSHLSIWRKQRDAGALAGLSERKRGQRSRKNPLAKKVAELEAENGGLRGELRKARVIIDVQKKVSRLLGSLSDAGNEGTD